MKYFNLISYLALGYLLFLFIKAIIMPLIHKRIYKFKEKKLLEKGNKKFYFEKNKVIVYAETREQANAKYKNMKKELKNNLKK